jgi:magnesium-transporting ATPase (P-type)
MGIKCIYAQGVSEHFTNGKESEVVFNYFRDYANNKSDIQIPNNQILKRKSFLNYTSIIIEDVVSNIVSFHYVALSNFFPRFMLSSNSLFSFGKHVISLQDGYHKEFEHLVYFHHLFLWYFYAGMVFSIFYFLFFRFLKRSFEKNKINYIYIVIIMLLITTGCFTHIFIKFRPYLSIPILSYKCIVSVLGVSILISFLLMIAQNYFKSKLRYVAVMTFVWLIIIYGGFSRPSHISFLASQLNFQRLPNPLMPIKELLLNFKDHRF